jgi:hypothetical protein
MKTKDLMTIVTVALATASLTVMTFWSGALNAGSNGDPPAAQIAKPKLVAHGIELTLAAADGRTLSGGDEPKFELTAVNPTDVAATALVGIAMTASSPADMLSRVPRLRCRPHQPANRNTSNDALGNRRGGGAGTVGRSGHSSNLGGVAAEKGRRCPPGRSSRNVTASLASW